MLKKIVRSYSFTLFTIVLFALSLVPLFLISEQFAVALKNPGTPFEVTLDLRLLIAPFILIVLGTIFTLFFFVGERAEKKSWMKIIFLPSEFMENDEREQMITAKSCRSAYIAMFFTAPAVAGVMTFYPLMQEAIPYLPVFAILFVLIVPITAYHWTARKYR
ncbi:hypothetical protein [Numidum massiliense]|uniref:hypothetical protein n=1 Tax=Numidum massiliense TaxID=1522315 RepID=UPI0006D5A14E|nr:hypothetical protein [Numidum massiliense]